MLNDDDSACSKVVRPPPPKDEDAGGGFDDAEDPEEDADAVDGVIGFGFRPRSLAALKRTASYRKRFASVSNILSFELFSLLEDSPLSEGGDEDFS